MKRPKIDVQQRKLSDLLYEMETGKLQVPRFQRNFVWPLSKTRRLLDSMYKEFPIGTFFLWRAPSGSPLLSRPLTELGIPEPQRGAEVFYILDGQQRLTSLFVTLKGQKLDSRNYGRISIDLETATRYDRNQEDGFDEDIFVYRSGDNRRYVAVCDLVGQSHLDIYEEIPKVRRRAFNKAHNILRETYPFSVVWIQEQMLGDAIEIFQRINQAGKRLSRYDLICANVWTKEFDFRKEVERLNRQFRREGFGKLHETIFTQTFALILKDRCTTAAELSLQTEEIIEAWDRIIRSLELAIDFAANTLGVKRARYLPYRGILPVLAYYFYHAGRSAISARERDTLWDWFWRVTLSERYSSTSPSRMAEDALKLKGAITGEEVSFPYAATVTPDDVARNRMTRTSSALRNAVICLLALKEPKNLKDSSPVNLSDGFFSTLKKPERHHIFPVGYLKERSVAATHVHLVPNFCFIPADLNREISNRRPSEYFTQYRRENPRFEEAAASHLLPVGPGAAIWQDDFVEFTKERAALIADELRRLVDSDPGEFVIPMPLEEAQSHHNRQIDILEVRLRDFIDDRLAAVVGSHYWKRTMPGDVINYTKKRVNQRLKSHPYEDWSDYPVGRARLDFCTPAHYELIFKQNWEQFEEFLGSKRELERHMSAFSALRNALKHNREPSDIEKQLGEAAMKWLGRILDRYEQEAEPETAEIEEDEEIEEVIETQPHEPPSSYMPSWFYGPLRTMVERTEHDVGPEAAKRLVEFLIRINETSLKKRSRKTTYVYRAAAWRLTSKDKPPKQTLTTVFMLAPDVGKPQLYFPVSWQWQDVVGFDWESHFEHLRALGGFADKDGSLWFNLQEHNDSESFEQIFAAIRQIVSDMEDTAKADEKNGGAPGKGTSLPTIRVPGRRASKALKSALAQVSNNLSEEATERLVHFLERVVKWDWQIQPQTLGVAFRARSLRRPRPSSAPKPMRTTVFFLRPDRNDNPRLVFPFPGQWQHVVGFDPAPHADRLQALGCVIGWKDSQLDLHLRNYNSAETFDQLYLVLQDIVDEMERSLDMKR